MILWAYPDQIGYNFDLVEMFSGEAKVSTTFRAAGLRAAQYDLRQSSDHNFLSRGGFAMLDRFCIQHAI